MYVADRFENLQDLVVYFIIVNIAFDLGKMCGK